MNEKILVRRPPRIVFYSPRAADRKRDEECVFLASIGKSRGFIMAKTGLSPSQVTLTLRKAGVRLADCRNGEKGTLGGRMGNLVIQAVRDLAEPQVINYIRKNVPRSHRSARAHTGPKGENPYPLEEAAR